MQKGLVYTCDALHCDIRGTNGFSNPSELANGFSIVRILRNTSVPKFHTDVFPRIQEGTEYQISFYLHLQNMDPTQVEFWAKIQQLLVSEQKVFHVTLVNAKSQLTCKWPCLDDLRSEVVQSHPKSWRDYSILLHYFPVRVGVNRNKLQSITIF